MKDYRHYFSRSLSHFKDYLLFQGHSHHLWPDAGFAGHEMAAHLAATQADLKWQTLYQDIIPKAKSIISSQLGLSHQDMVFAPNTHELLTRLMETLMHRGAKTLCTTTSEFYSARRQFQSYQTAGLLKVNWQKHEFTDSAEQILENLGAADIVFFSQCFFDNARFLPTEEIEKWLAKIPSSTTVIIDLYHSYATRQLKLDQINQRCYLLAGSYKYAMAGEGVGFLIPPQQGPDLNPINTGWFAQFELLENNPKTLQYPQGAQRFSGATYDPSGLCRFVKVWQMWQDEKITLNDFHQHAIELQKKLSTITQPQGAKLLYHPEQEHGHFLCWQFQTRQQASEYQQKLLDRKILCDSRENYLRLGQAPYLHSIPQDLF